MRVLRSSMRDKGLSGLKSIGLLALTLLLAGCFSPEDFEVRAVSISNLTSLGTDQTELGVDLVLYNPNGYAVQIQDSRLGLWLSGDSVGTLRFTSSEAVPKKSEAPVHLEATLDSELVGRLLSGHAFEYLVEGAPIRVEGWVKGKAGWFQSTLDIRHEQRIRLMN